MHFFNENYKIPIVFTETCSQDRSPMDNKPELRRTGDKPLHESMMTEFIIQIKICAEYQDMLHWNYS